MRLFHVKDIDCVKDLIQLNRWKKKKPGVTDVKSHHLVKCAMVYGCFSSTENQIPETVDEFKRIYLVAAT